jgi:hypothetical protein
MVKLVRIYSSGIDNIAMMIDDDNKPHFFHKLSTDDLANVLSAAGKEFEWCDAISKSKVKKTYGFDLVKLGVVAK